MAATNIALPEPLLAEIRTEAQAEDRAVDEVVVDAVRNYLDSRSWLRFAERNERRAKEMGISEDDVDRLIADYRSENGNAGF